MSEKLNDSGATYEAEPIPVELRKSNGSDPRQKRKNTGDPLPGINIRELVDERNWTALAGLALIGLGALYIIQRTLNLDFVLWAWMLLAAGGWLMADAWQKYRAAGQRWVGHTRNRMVGGAVTALVGLLGTLHISWSGLSLLGFGAWLGYDAWRKYNAAGHVWTERTRRRMVVAGGVALLGLFILLPSWSAWPLLVIVVGGVMLYRHIGGKACC